MRRWGKLGFGKEGTAGQQLTPKAVDIASARGAHARIDIHGHRWACRRGMYWRLRGAHAPRLAMEEGKQVHKVFGDKLLAKRVPRPRLSTPRPLVSRSLRVPSGPLWRTLVPHTCSERQDAVHLFLY